jgi:hypothetical protein
MMEQLAERRMQREEDTQYASASPAHHMHSGHNHGPPLDEEEYDEDDEEDYDSQEEEEYEEDEMVCSKCVRNYGTWLIEHRTP